MWNGRISVDEWTAVLMGLLSCSPCKVGDQRARLCGADHEIVQVAAHLESARLFDPADLHRLEAGRSNQPLDFVATTVVVGHVEQHRRLG